MAAEATAVEAVVTVMAEAGTGLVVVRMALVVMAETVVACTRNSPRIRQTCTSCSTAVCLSGTTYGIQMI